MRIETVQDNKRDDRDLVFFASVAFVFASFSVHFGQFFRPAAWVIRQETCRIKVCPNTNLNPNSVTYS
jgi:hypothetical protein